MTLLPVFNLPPPAHPSDCATPYRINSSVREPSSSTGSSKGKPDHDAKMHMHVKMNMSLLDMKNTRMTMTIDDQATLRDDEIDMTRRAEPFAPATGAIPKRQVSSKPVAKSKTKTRAKPSAELIEIRRLRHLEIVRRGRQRKKKEIESMRYTLDQLEATLERLKGHTGHTDSRFQTRELLIQNATQSFQMAYNALMDETVSLRDANAEMKKQTLSYETFLEQMRRFTKDFGVLDSMSRAFYTPLPMITVDRIRHETWQEGDSFFRRMSQDNSSPHAGTLSMIESWGWEQKARNREGDKVVFHFFKRFHSINVDLLMERSWHMYINLEAYKLIYATTQRLDILQEIDQDTLVIQRELLSHQVVFRTIFLLCRIRIENGYMICFYSLNPSEQEDPTSVSNGRRVKWLFMRYWLKFIGDPSGVGCEVKFGGYLLNEHSLNYANYWIYEILFAAVRWESSAVTPAICVAPDAESKLIKRRGQEQQ